MERHRHSISTKVLREVMLCCVAVLTSCGARPGSADYELALPRGYTLFRSSGHNINITHTNIEFPEIPAKVVETGWNERFILAKQQLLKNRGDFPSDNFQVPNPGKYQFWIIDVLNTNRVGPLNEKTFNEQRKVLGVPNTLKMRPPGVYAK